MRWGLAVLLACCVCWPARAAEPLALHGGADVHQHVTMARQLKPFFVGESGTQLATSPRQLLVNQVSAGGLRRAGLELVVATVWPPLALRPGRTAMDETLAQLEELTAFTLRRPQFSVVLDAQAAQRVRASGRLALVPAVEGAEAVRSVEDVDRLYAAGARFIQLVHFTDNALADADDDQFTPAAGLVLNGAAGGLTPLGRAAVQRMMELGLVVDVAHASVRTISDVLDLAEPRGVPILFSHAGPTVVAALHPPDGLLRRIARGGGLIGVGVFRSDFLKPTPDAWRWEGQQRRTCDDQVALWRHVAQVAGEDAVVLGSDFGSVVDRARPGGFCPDGLRNVGDAPWLWAGLVARGTPKQVLSTQAERVLRLWKQVEAHRTARPVVTHVHSRGFFEVPFERRSGAD